MHDLVARGGGAGACAGIAGDATDSAAAALARSRRASQRRAARPGRAGPRRSVAPTREEVAAAAARAGASAPRRAADRRGRRRAGALRARPARISGHPLHPDRRRSSTICAGSPPEALRPAFAPYLGQEHPIAAICEIRDRAATILRDAGYIAAVEVPEQRIADGTVRFQVLMAKLVGLRVRGDAGRSERTIAGYLERLTEQEVFNRFEAERYLLLAGDLPGFDVRLALRSAGAARGEVIGEVTVVRRAGRRSTLTVQNLGSRELGRWGALLRGQVFGLTGLGDRTTHRRLQHRRHVRAADAAGRATISGSAARASPSAASSPTPGRAPISASPGVDIDSRTLFATLEASYPFVRRQARTLRGAIGLDIIDQDVDFNAHPAQPRPAARRLRPARLRRARPGRRQSALHARPSRAGGSSATAELRQGLDLLGASQGCGAGARQLLRARRRRRRPGSRAIRPRPCCAAALYGEFRPMPQLTFALGAARPV